MDFDDPRVRRVFFDVHNALPREGPGNREATARALRLCGALPPEPRVLDLACGPGMQTIDLAALLPAASIVALDSHEPFVGEVRRRAAERGVQDRVLAVHGDMAALAYPAGAFDLIWCEGAAYMMGFANALASWRPFLASGGRLALTEAVWLGPDPPVRARACWAEYPDMRGLAECRDRARSVGFRVLGDFVLPEAAWWDDYYGPMAARLDLLEPHYAGDAVAEGVLAHCREEIAVYRDFSAWYGYAFFVLTPD